MAIVKFSRSAQLTWEGAVVGGTGRIAAGTGAFETGATFPTLRGERAGTTTPEELLAASHATCFGIGLRSVIARQGGTARRIVVVATITAEKGLDGIRIRSSHLEGTIDDLQGIDEPSLSSIGHIVEKECTISAVIRGSVEITHHISISNESVSPGDVSG
jgi:lipoyl-dependent peroxiredoxin